jgi:hypothetical protein
MFHLAAINNEATVKVLRNARSKGHAPAMNTSIVNQSLAPPPSSPVSVLQSCTDLSRNTVTVNRSITWSDESGEALEHFRFIPRRERSHFNSDVRRLIILLLSPSHRKYEFICCEYPLTSAENSRNNGKITVKDVLDQLPGMASHDLLKRQTYIALCRRDNTELINALSIESYNLSSFEMLWAVPSHHHSKQLAPMVSCVLSNKGLLRALRHSTAHWEVHTLMISQRPHAGTAILDKLRIKQGKQDEYRDTTFPSSDEDEEAQLKRTFPLCPAPTPDTYTVSPSIMSMLRHRSFPFSSNSSLLSSFLPKSRNNATTERQRYLVTLFAGHTGLFHRKRLKGSKQDKAGAIGQLSDCANGISMFHEERCAI